MARIIPVATSRVSDLMLSTRLVSQLSSTQVDLLRVQTQLSTGRRLISPSEDAPAAMRGLTLQSLIERKEQIQVNLITSQSYLTASDVALSNAANIMNDMRGLAVSLTDTTSTSAERDAAREQVRFALQQMIDIGNQKFRGRYLFAGSTTTAPPFEQTEEGLVNYTGNTDPLRSFADIDLLFDTTVNGDEAFGTISKEIKGTVDFNPVLKESTRLSELRGGRGISAGSFTISDGVTTSTIDISSAETIGDIIHLIEDNPPEGRTVTARIDAQSLIVDIDDAGGGNLTIQEVGGSRIAGELGILNIEGNLTEPIVGRDLDPVLSLTTDLNDILGQRAQTILEYPGFNNDILIQANANGNAFNDYKLQLVDDSTQIASGGVSSGFEVVQFGSDLQRPQVNLNLDGADNALLLTANTTDGSLDNVVIEINASNDIGDAAVIGPVTDVDGVSTITIQVDDSDETTLSTLVNEILADGRFSVGLDASAGEGFDSTQAVASSNDGLTAVTEIVSTDVKAKASVSFSGATNDLLLTANQPGIDFNDIEIVIDASGDIGDAASASYSDDGTNRTLTISIDDTDETTLQSIVDAIIEEGTFSVQPDDSDGDTFDPSSVVQSLNQGVIGNTNKSGGDAKTIFVNIDSGDSNANDIIAALNNSSQFSELFTAELDNKDATTSFFEGTGIVDTDYSGTLEGGSGVVFDKSSGIQVNNGNDLLEISFDNAETVEDLLNILNGAGTGLVARINDDQTGIDVQSTLSGADFTIGENGGETATQLGLRTLTGDTQLSRLNYGIGVRTTEGTDFTITRNDGVELEIDLTAAKTIDDVITLINNHPDNLDSNPLFARLKSFGNGIELVDDNPQGVGRLKIERNVLSYAAIDLGFMPDGEQVITTSDSQDASLANASVGFDEPNHLNTAINLTANLPGEVYNDIQIEFVNNLASGNQALVSFDATQQKLTIDVDPTLTTANTVISQIIAEGTFHAELDSSEDLTNNGSGVIATTGIVAATSGGTPISDAEFAFANIEFASPGDTNTALELRALYPGTGLNDVEVIFNNSLAPGGTPTALYSSSANQLVVEIESGVTTSLEIMQAINSDHTFYAQLDRSNDLTNDGSGTVSTVGTVATTTGGSAEVLSGTEVNPSETLGIFNSLIRLDRALEANNVLEISRAAQLLDEDIRRLSFTRAELGSRDENVDILKYRMEEETIELKASLSEEIDVDMVETISNMTAQQAAFEASLRTIGQIYQLTLLDFI